MQPIAYLISDGTLDDFTKVYIHQGPDDLESAIDHFVAHTKTPYDQIVINPVMTPIADLAQLNANQKFVAVTVTRDEIAADLNALVEIEDDEIEVTDSRLTDEFCAEFAKEYGEQITTDADDVSDSEGWTSLIQDALAKLNERAKS